MKKIQSAFWIVAIVLCLIVACNMETKPRNITPVPAEQKAEQQVEKSAVKENTDDFYPGVARARSLWVENARYLYDYEDGFKSGDKEFLLQMVREGKAKFVENPAGVVCSGEYKQGKVIKIRFFEGRYKNKSGYIFADFVQKIKEK